MGWRTTAARRPRARSSREIQRLTGDLPQPVRTADTAITGTPAAIMVRCGPSSMKSAPAASAREARCITSAWARSL